MARSLGAARLLRCAQRLGDPLPQRSNVEARDREGKWFGRAGGQARLGVLELTIDLLLEFEVALHDGFQVFGPKGDVDFLLANDGLQTRWNGSPVL
jgi:hypothetical protein